MVKRYKGGLMSSTEDTTSIGDASGMWGTVQATQARNTGNWPGLLATETPGSGSGAGFANGFMTVSNVAVTDSSYNILNDTPNISTAGGFIRITGRGFASGCVVYVGGTPATSTTFVSSTEVRAQIAAATSNTLMVYVVNPDGSTGIKLNSLVFSGTPTWVTGTTLGTQVSDAVFSISFSATSDSAVTYTLDTGSSLPPGTTLYANGLFTGTVTGITSDTTYSFSVVANDAENQDTTRTFSVTIASGDQYFNITPLLLNGDANVWIRDSSVNSFLPTIGGDTRPTAFSPYGINWSTYFDGSNDDVRVGGNNNLAFGTGDFTIEMFFNSGIIGGSNQYSFLYDGRVSATAEIVPIIGISPSLTVTFGTGAATVITSGTISLYRWYHLVVSRVSGSTRMFLDGVQTGSTASDANNYGNNTGRPCIGTQGYGDPFFNFQGYISNMRVRVGTGTAAPTVPTAPLTAITNTQLLLFQDNRIKDNSTNAFAITQFADLPTVRSFGPFVDTDTTTGSAYFDGTGDYLTIADNSAMELGAGDFCVECWIYPTSVTNTAVVIDKRSGGYAPLLLWRSTSTLQLYMSINGSSWLVNGVTVGVLVVNRWYHVAVFRVGTSIYTSFNGVVTLVTASGSGTLVNNATNWYIGTETNGSTNPWTGYIADMRFVVGSSVYTSANFTPTTSSLSSVANTQLLTLQYRRGDNNHRFIDEAGPKALIARNGNASQGSFSPFSADDGYWSVAYPANARRTYGTMSTSIINVNSTSTFTVEGWIMLTGTAATFYPMVCTTDFSTGATWIAGANSSRRVNFYWYNGSVQNCTGNTVLNIGQWYFIQIRASSGALSIGINGVAETLSGTTTLTSTTGDNAYISFGSERTYANPCYLYDVRISNTVRSYTLPTTIQSADANTTFLGLRKRRIYDESSLATVLTNTALTQPWSPFRPSAAYTPATHGGSAYFDGTGDYLDYAAPVNLTFGTSDFTIEFWVYGLVAGAAWWCYDSRPGGDGAYPLVYWDGTSFVYYVSTAARITSTAINIVGQWTHVVVSRVSGSTRMFVNGTVQSTVYTDATSYLNPGATRPRIGLNGLNGLNPSTGYLSGLRVSVGPGVTSVTVPTAPPSFTANAAILNNFTNAGIIDATGRHIFETLGDAKISNVASKFGTGSLYFDGTSDALYEPYSHLYSFGTGDFTIEFWINFSSKTGYQTIISNGYVGGYVANGWLIQTGNGDGNMIFYYMTTGAVAVATESGSTVNTGTWYHMAIVRTGGNTKIYRNGTQVATAADTVNYSPASTAKFYIGGGSSNGLDSFYLNGYIDDLRITRFARYTANFTAPASAHLLK